MYMSKNVYYSPVEIEFLKYYFASASFLECLEYMDTYEHGLDVLDKNINSFKHAMEKSIVITYARPFTNNRSVQGRNIGKISDRWINELPKEQRDIHREFVNHGRNSLVAHIDFSIIKPFLSFKDGQLYACVHDYTVPSINKKYNNDFRVLLQEAQKFCSKKMDDIIPHLPEDRIYPKVYIIEDV